MKKIKCDHCGSVFGIKNPNKVVRDCPKCGTPFKAEGFTSENDEGQTDDFMSLLRSLDDKSSDSDESAIHPTQGIAGLTMQEDKERRQRIQRNNLIKRLSITSAVLVMLAILCFMGIGYVNNMFGTRAFRADWEDAKKLIEENYEAGKYRSAINQVVAFESTITEETPKGEAVDEIMQEVASLRQKIQRAQDDVYLGINESLERASKHRSNQALDLAQAQLNHAKYELDAVEEKDQRLISAEERWSAETFLVLATPIFEYGRNNTSEQTVLEFAAKSNIASVHAHLKEHPELEEAYPDVSLIVIAMYHWSQVARAHQLNAESEWDESVNILRKAREAALKNEDIPRTWPTLMVAIEQVLTLTIYDRIDTSRAHIKQLVGLELLPGAVLACKDLVEFVNELYSVMVSTNSDGFDDLEARAKAKGFQSYAKALIVELEWQILSILIETTNIKSDQTEEFLAEYLKTEPSKFASQAKSIFGQVEKATEKLEKEMKNLESIEDSALFQNIEDALQRNLATWKTLSAAADDYAANIGKAKSFDKFSNAAVATISAYNTLNRNIDGIPLPPEEPEDSEVAAH